MKKQNYGSIPPSRVKLSSFDPPFSSSSSSSTLFSSLFSFGNKLPIAIEIPDESHRLILFRFTSACHVRPFSSKTLPVSKQSHRCRHKGTRLCISSRVISFWSKRNFYNRGNILSRLYMFCHWKQGNRPLKIIFQIGEFLAKTCHRGILNGWIIPLN